MDLILWRWEICFCEVILRPLRVDSNSSASKEDWTRAMIVLGHSDRFEKGT